MAAGRSDHDDAVAQLPSVRAMYGGDGPSESFNELKALGVNTVHVRPHVPTLNQLHSLDMQAVIWLGEHHRRTCEFELTDHNVEALVGRIAGHPAVAAYQIADEPRTTNCPNAAEQISERATLVHSLDPGAPTYVTVDAWNGKEVYPYADCAGTTDIMGLVVYPCEASVCNLSAIERAIASAHSAGVERYWAVIQAFGDSYYTMPDAETFTAQLDRWAESDAEGISIFSWRFGRADVSRSPEIQDLIRSAWVIDEPTPTPTPKPTATETPTNPAQPTSTSTGSPTTPASSAIDEP
jgi:hypothetical protein